MRRAFARAGGMPPKRAGSPMYNNKGRGFTGFRKIVTEDVAQGLRTGTIYEQKFPLVSQAICTATQLTGDPLTELNCSSGRAISATKTDEIRCNNQVCFDSNAVSTYVPPATPVTTPLRVETSKSSAITRDLTTRNMVTSSATTTTFDSYGNPLTQGVATVDFDGTNATGTPANTVRTVSAGTTNTYDNNATNWWINKLVASTSTSAQTYGVKHPNGPVVPPRTTSSLIGYEPNSRLPQCEATMNGTSTAACTQSLTGFERFVWRTFGAYGNVTGEAISARDMPLVRGTGTDYSASEGYFPNIVTDANGRSAVTVFDPRFGTAIQVTDANQLVSTVTLDAVGRAIRTVAPSADGKRAAMPATVSFERCALVACPPNAVMRVVKSQYGSAQSWSYIDSLGRTIKTASQLMEAAYATSSSGLVDSTASITEMFYNNKGQIDLQYEPGRGGSNGSAYTRNYFDALGRPVRKLQRFGRVDEDTITNAETFRRTEYSHSGLKTDIRVCQVSIISAACPASGLNGDGSPILNMSRSFDSAGKLISTTDANQQAIATQNNVAPKTTRYWFDGMGNPIQITDVMGKNITANYDNFGYRKSVTDVDRGTWVFTYNGLGEVLSQTDARSRRTDLVYDNLGRTTQRTWQETTRGGGPLIDFSETQTFDVTGATTYGNLLSTKRLGGTSGTTSYERWENTPTYDALNRSIGSTTLMQSGQSASVSMTTQQFFDRNYGRPKQSNYPVSIADGKPVSIYMAYNPVGALVREGFAADYNATAPLLSPAIHTTNAQDGRGLVTSESLGVTAANTADWRLSSAFDSSGWLLAQCVNNSGVCDGLSAPTTTANVPLEQRYRFDVYGNLKTQWHSGAWMPNVAPVSNGVHGKETYTYDALHRLTSAARTGADNLSNTVSYDYDAIGGLLKKSDYSLDNSAAYSYFDGTHKVQSVALKSGGTAGYGYDLNGNVTLRSEQGVQTSLEYDVGNLPRRMQKGFNTSEFYDGPGGRFLQRLINAGTTRDTYYLGKSYEREIVGNVTTERYYLTSGSLLTVRSTGRELNYLHTDRLGSIVSISRKPLLNDGKLGSGVVSMVEHRGFDAFGKALDGNWGTSNKGMINLGIGDFAFNPSTNSSLFNQYKRNQRGFTGHEHLDEFALIHMNGRAYDYNLGRFYGVDPFIQFPSNSQSLNPYGYLMNNPLAGTDPTGYAMSCDAKSQCKMTDVENIYIVKEKQTGEWKAIATDGKNHVEVATVKYKDANGAPQSVDLSRGRLNNLLASDIGQASLRDTSMALRANRNDVSASGTTPSIATADAMRSMHFDHYMDKSKAAATGMAIGAACSLPVVDAGCGAYFGSQALGAAMDGDYPAAAGNAFAAIVSGIGAASRVASAEARTAVAETKTIRLETEGASSAVRTAESASIPNETPVVRGGAGTSPESFKIGQHPEGPTGFSVESAQGATLQTLCANCRYNQVRISTAGDIRQAGGDVIPTAGRSPTHATVINLSPERANSLFPSPVLNPIKKPDRLIYDD